MPRNSVTLMAIVLATSMLAACATRSTIEATPNKAEGPGAVRAPAAPKSAETPATGMQTGPAESSPKQQVAILRVEAGALVTQVNGDRKLACTNPKCDIPLPAGTHTLTVGYKDTETRAGSRVTFASMHSRTIEVTLEPGHAYSLTASGRYSPKWWIAIEDQTANKTIYNDRERPE